MLRGLVKDMVNGMGVHRLRSGRTRSAVVGAVGALALTSGMVAALADGDPATAGVSAARMIIPYEGELRVDGQAIDGVVPMVFTLHSGVDCADCAIWTEAQSVTVTNGRFSAPLGAVTAVDDAVWDLQKVYLSVTANGVALSGRQALEPVAYAHWTGDTNSEIAVNDIRPVPGRDAVQIGGTLEVREQLVRLGPDATPLMQYSGGGLRINADSFARLSPVRIQSPLHVAGQFRPLGGPLDCNGKDLVASGSLRAVSANLPESTQTVTASASGTRFTINSLSNAFPDCTLYPATAVRFKQDSPGVAELELKCAHQ